MTHQRRARPAGLFQAKVWGWVVLPLGILWATTYWGSAFFWTQHSKADLSTMARLAVRRFEHLVQWTEDLAGELLNDPAFLSAVRARDGSGLKRLLHAFLQHHPQIEQAILWQPDGTVGFELPHVVGSIERDLIWAETLGGDQSLDQWPKVSHLTRSSQGGDRLTIVGIAVPVLDGTDFLGVLEVQYHAEQLESWIAQVRSSEMGGFLYVVDNSSHVVVHPYRVLTGEPQEVTSWLPLDRLTGQGPLMLKVHDERGRLNLVMAERTTFGWWVVAQQSFKRMQAQARRAYFPVMVISSVVVLLAWLVGFWLGRSKRFADCP